MLAVTIATNSSPPLPAAAALAASASLNSLNLAAAATLSPAFPSARALALSAATWSMATWGAAAAAGAAVTRSAAAGTATTRAACTVTAGGALRAGASCLGDVGGVRIWPSCSRSERRLGSLMSSAVSISCAVVEQVPGRMRTVGGGGG